MKTILIVLALLLVLAPASALAGGPKDTSPGNSGEHKVTICHHAGPTKTITITVDEHAVPAHLAHGDTLGVCPTPPDDGGTDTGTTPVPPVVTTPVPTPTTPTVTEPTPTTPTTVTPPTTKKPKVVVKRHKSATPQPDAAPVVAAPKPTAAPVTHRRLAQQAGGQALPYTGLPVGILFALGALLLSAGVAVRRFLATE